MPACVACGGEYFRTVRHPVSEKPLPLYPAPGTRFLVISLESGGTATGLAICPDCVSRKVVEIDGLSEKVPGMTGISGLETGKEQNAWWYSPGYGRFLDAWLRDHLRFDPEPFVRQWTVDCEAEGVTSG